MDIVFELHNNLNIRIDTVNYNYLKGVDEELTEYVKNYMFTPRFKSGVWSGRISLFKRATRTFPYGLLVKVLRYTKKDWPELSYDFSQDVKELFNGISFSNFKNDLIFPVHDYQGKAIQVAVEKSKGICQLPTASGKSFVITHIIKHITENSPENNSIIVVPTLQLIDQFIDDMDEYGIDIDTIGRVNSNHKEFGSDIVVSTWQSIKNNLEQMARYNTVIIDEVHGAKADKVLELLGACPQANFRIGMTGTMPNHPLEYMNVMSLLGPVLIKYTGKDLANMGYISHCTVKTIKIFYDDDLNEQKYDYTSVRDMVFLNRYRLGLIQHLISKTNNSVLILVEKVEKEGEVLEEILTTAFPNKKIIFLSGRDKAAVRDKARKEMNNVDDMVIIATYQIFQQGVNIKSLRSIILASSTKSFIRVIQSLGRALRKHVSKEIGGAELYDIWDQTKYLAEHGEKRERHYIKEGHEIQEFELMERMGVYGI